ncbi:hypothetical protein HBI56_221180 [Parastagonospora nodorum]|nr:hypothetical protein HBI80_234060 [Parastagonospora nodorum]KAH5008388.1 hypothetical protein HBI75_214570 [Parastagonospora nodorum]KAH6479896.1 hypothetical protein HBI56_221180 [Parastagonospora nodorum]
MRTVEARPGQHQCKDADDTSFLKTAQLTTLHSKQESESPIDPAGAHTPNRMSRIVLVFASDEGFDSCLEWIERIVLKQGRTHRNAC